MADRDLDAAIAITRFGLGAKPGEIARARSDPKGFLAAQIRPSGADQPRTNGETSAQRIAGFRVYQQDKQRRAASEGEPASDARDPVKIAQRMLRDDVATDFMARARLGAETDAGFRERWTLFWANHFTVSPTSS